ncbi:MAG: hypothetical protein CR988_07590 [Treponema sp.]|nr:MAG: hypothetical protein CR988_07590 [Treponema sp.]
MKRKNIFFKNSKHAFRISLIIFIFTVLVLSVFLFLRYRKKHSSLPSPNEIADMWNEQRYADVYDASAQILAKEPLNAEILAIHGFSSYYLFSEETDKSLGYTYLSDCIASLRKALIYVPEKEKQRISYILGKAYYHKGYFYSNLALKYLDIAYEGDEKFDDLPEFRGMSASLLKLPQKAISAFTEALEDNPSDLVLFALAQNYLAINDTSNAKMYLSETIKKTEDILLEIDARYLLGTIFIDEGDIKKAEQEYLAILDKNANSANAYYGLGLIYEIKGDLVKARAKWRKALKIDPLHADTRMKLKL